MMLTQSNWEFPILSLYATQSDHFFYLRDLLKRDLLSHFCIKVAKHFGESFFYFRSGREGVGLAELGKGGKGTVNGEPKIIMDIALFNKATSLDVLTGRAKLVEKIPLYGINAFLWLIIQVFFKCHT